MNGASSDDVSVRTRFVGVGGDGFAGFEVQVAFDRKAEFAPDAAKLREAYVAEFGAAHAEIAEAEGEVGAFVDFGEEPGALGVGGVELDDGLEVERLVLSIDGGALCDAIGEELFGLCFGDATSTYHDGEPLNRFRSPRVRHDDRVHDSCHVRDLTCDRLGSVDLQARGHHTFEKYYMIQRLHSDCIWLQKRALI